MPDTKRVNRLIGLNIDEMSGVDFPAHLHDGWLVIKDADGLRDVLDRARAVGSSTDDKESNMPEGINLDTISDEATRKAVEDLLKQVNDGDGGDDLQAKVDEAISKAKADWEADLAALAAEDNDDGDGGGDPVLRSLPEDVRKMVEDRVAKAESEAAEATFIAKAERYRSAEAEFVADFVTKHEHIAEPDKVAKSLFRLEVEAPTEAETFRKSLDAANGQLESADIFRSLGSDLEPDEDSAEGRLEALAKSRADEKGETFEQAYAHVIKTAEGRRLYAESQGGNR